MVATFPIVIETMTPDDIPAVQEVERASFPVPWPANAFRHELTQNKNARYIVAREGGRIIAYAGLWLALDEAHITTFAVLPERGGARSASGCSCRLFDLATELIGRVAHARGARLELPGAAALREVRVPRRAGSAAATTATTTRTRSSCGPSACASRAVRDRLAKLRAELEED